MTPNEQTKNQRKYNTLLALRFLSPAIIFSATVLTIHITDSVETNIWNPYKKFQIMKQKVKEREIYYEKWKELFGDWDYDRCVKQGLVHRSDANKVSALELLNAYKRMGYYDTNCDAQIKYGGGGSICFPTPTIEDLERAIQSYKDEHPKPF